MTAVTLVLLVVAVISRFIQYLSDAVAGEIASDVLLLLMLYRLPEFLLVIIPLALFLGILLAYGRMYADNEMVVLMGSGFSQRRLLILTLGTAAIVALVIAVLSFDVAPRGVRQAEILKQNQEQLTEIDLIVAGQFQRFGDGSRVTYAERIESGISSRELRNVFVAQTVAEDSNLAPRIVLAESARPEIDESTGARFMRLENVLQYDGVPGAANFTIAQSDVQSILLPEAAEFEEIIEETTLSTGQLLGSELPTHIAELQWRLSMLLVIPIITLIAVPMSQVNPRQGRYSKLIPAVLIYAAYIILLQSARDSVADGGSALLGLWWVHGLFLLIGVVLYQKPKLGNYFLWGKKHETA